MTVRRLTKEDKYEAGLASSIAFHSRHDDLEKKRIEWEKDETEDWGAFTPEGTLASRILNFRYTSNLNGYQIENGGIAGVTTLPEYRESGSIRAIFTSLLPSAYANGEVISSLYPFNHAFYRKFGYETVLCQNEYTLTPDLLRQYSFRGKAVMWKEGEDVEEFTRLYNTFAKDYNLSMVRDNNLMQKAHIVGNLYKDRVFTYMLYLDNQAVAYCTFTDVYCPEAAKLEVQDVCWTSREGFLSVLGFLSRFTADYGNIVLPMPEGVDLYSIIHTPNLYNIQKSACRNYMVRVINVQKALACMDIPENASFTIEVSDAFIPENTGTWLVSGSDHSVTRTEQQPDICVSIPALSQIVTGGIDYMEACLREDVSIRSNTQTLKHVIVHKPRFVTDHF